MGRLIGKFTSTTQPINYTSIFDNKYIIYNPLSDTSALTYNFILTSIRSYAVNDGLLLLDFTTT